MVVWLISSSFPPLQPLRWRQAGQDHRFVALGVNDDPLRVQLGGYVVSRGDLVEKVTRRWARIHQRLLQLLLLFDSPRWTENHGIVGMQATEIMLLLVAWQLLQNQFLHAQLPMMSQVAQAVEQRAATVVFLFLFSTDKASNGHLFQRTFWLLRLVQLLLLLDVGLFV